MDKGTLYIVSTPIGTMKDITLRALEVLRDVDLIAAEDTRRTKKLLNFYNIRVPLTSYFEHNESVKAPLIIRKMEEGKDVALVSDAGTPGISDPGYRLVRLSIESSIRVVPIPGPSAIISALSASGMPTDRFFFLGYVPAKKKDRERFLISLKREKGVIIVYESPRRVIKTLNEVIEIIGDVETVVARELTKIHEEFIRGRVSDVVKALEDKEIRGEITLLLKLEADEKIDERAIIDVIRGYQESLNLPLKEIVRIVADEMGLPKRVVYKEALKLKDR